MKVNVSAKPANHTIIEGAILRLCALRADISPLSATDRWDLMISIERALTTTTTRPSQNGISSSRSSAAGGSNVLPLFDGDA